MNILQESSIFCARKILPTIRKRHKRLFSFGIQSLTLQPYVSLNGNARKVVANRATAEQKMYRLTGTEEIPDYFSSLVSQLHLLHRSDIVNVDFSTFSGFQVLTFAKHTYLGRAIPIHFNTITYPVDEGSQNLFIIEEVKKMKHQLGFCPSLVFDRGFEIPSLIEALLTEKIIFYIRVRKDKHALYEGMDLPLWNLPWYEQDAVVTIYGTRLRVVVSEKVSERTNSEGKEEPWYILTNDFISPKNKIIAHYYFRFEIEETFKDLKHINKLKNLFPITKQLTFKILLGFCTLSIWLSFLLKNMKHFLKHRVKQKRRKRLSVTRYFFEQIDQIKTMYIQNLFAA